MFVMAGDLNLNASTPLVSEALACAGFRDAVPTAREATTPHRGLPESGHRIGGAFVWGSSQPNAGKVLKFIKSFRSLPNLIRVAAELCRPKNYALWFDVILSELP